VTSKPGKELSAVREILDFLIPWDVSARGLEVGRWPGVGLIKTALSFDRCVTILRKHKRYIALKVVPLLYIASPIHDEIRDLFKKIALDKKPNSIYLTIAKRGVIDKKDVFLAALEGACAHLSEKGEQLVVMVEGLGDKVGISPLNPIEYYRLAGKRKLPRRLKVDPATCQHLLSYKLN